MTVQVLGKDSNIDLSGAAWTGDIWEDHLTFFLCSCWRWRRFVIVLQTAVSSYVKIEAQAIFFVWVEELGLFLFFPLRFLDAGSRHIVSGVRLTIYITTLLINPGLAFAVFYAWNRLSCSNASGGVKKLFFAAFWTENLLYVEQRISF